MNRIAMLTLTLTLLTSMACSRDAATDTSSTVAATTTAITTATSSSAAGTVVTDSSENRAASATTATTAAREAEAARSIGADQQAAVDVVHAYYRAIDARRFEEAYRFWGSRGAPGQTMKEFADGFADTVTTQVKTGEPSGIGAAAGSRYVEIPVAVVATTRSGESQHFEGTYTLRRTVVDGATPAERAWHFDRASMRAVR